MAFVTVPFTHSSFGMLKRMGLKIPFFTTSIRLKEESWFEPPLAIMSEIQGDNYLQVGAFCSISGGLLGHCEVGRYCAFAPEVVIGANEHPTDWLTVSRVTHVRGLHEWDAFLYPDDPERARSSVMPYDKSTRTTRIGNDVWIGQRSLIRSGITVGDGAIVAAGSVVSKDVPPFAIVAGVPARVIKMRFADALVERLLRLQWWRYNVYDFEKIPYDRIEAALDTIEEQAARKGIQPYAPAKVTASDLVARFTSVAVNS